MQLEKNGFFSYTFISRMKKTLQKSSQFFNRMNHKNTKLESKDQRHKHANDSKLML